MLEHTHAHTHIQLSPIVVPTDLLWLQDFSVSLSILLRGCVAEKLRWVFNLYDINRDGCISREVLHLPRSVCVCVKPPRKAALSPLCA